MLKLACGASKKRRFDAWFIRFPGSAPIPKLVHARPPTHGARSEGATRLFAPRPRRTVPLRDLALSLALLKITFNEVRQAALQQTLRPVSGFRAQGLGY